MKSFIKQDIPIPRYTTRNNSSTALRLLKKSGRVDADERLTTKSLIGRTNWILGSIATKASPDKQAKPRRRNDIRNACMNP